MDGRRFGLKVREAVYTVWTLAVAVALLGAFAAWLVGPFMQRG